MQFQSFIQSGLIFHIACINRIIIQRISISVDKWMRSPTFYRQQEEVDFKSIVPGVYHAEGGTLSFEPFLPNQHLPRENIQTIIDLQ